MVYVNENRATICKGDYHPAELYKGETKIAGFTKTEISGEGTATLESCYNDRLYDAKIEGNSMQDGTPSPDNPIEIQSAGELVTEGDYAGKYKIGVTARGKNLFNYEKYSYSIQTSNGLTCEHIGNGIFHVYGTVTTYSDYINFLYSGRQSGIFKQGKQYKSKHFLTNNSYLYAMIGVKNSSGSFIANIGTAAPAYTIPSEGCYIGYIQITCVRVPLDTTLDEYIQVQLEEGASADTYEPYIEPQTFDIYLDEPLRKVGNYADYIDFENGAVVRYITKKTLTGGESWAFDPVVSNKGLRFYIQTTRTVKNWSKNEVMGVSNRLKGVTSYGIWQNYYATDGSLITGIFVQHGNYSEIYFRLCPYSTLPTIEEWKATLTQWNEEGNPMVVWYVEAPIEEEIELSELPTFKGTTIYETDTSITANINGIYKKENMN